MNGARDLLACCRLQLLAFVIMADSRNISPEMRNAVNAEISYPSITALVIATTTSGSFVVYSLHSCAPPALENLTMIHRPTTVPSGVVETTFHKIVSR